MNKSFIKYLTFIVILLLIFKFSYSLLFNKYSIFNYLNYKSKMETLNKTLQNKIIVKEKLLQEISILKNNSVINIDILEKESIKKLNKIPNSYKILIQ